MFDDEFKIDRKNTKAMLVSIACPKLASHATLEDADRSMVELYELTKTLGLSIYKDVIQQRQELDPATVLGKGKIEEIGKEARENDVNLLVFDFELTAGQIKNIKNISNILCIDRCHVILEIFASHAHTKDAKIQIEMARLKYLLPRLTGFWGHFSKQRAARGTVSGEGEKQIELDRRIIKDRIEFYKKELRAIQRARSEQRKKRANQAITAALVGYTNAGKSSIMNRLCNVLVLEENKLFATLDSTYRTLNPDSKPPMIMIDTVGFISNLPNTLIEGFKTTLESAQEADLLVLVCDVSDPHFKKHLDVTKEVLQDLKLNDKPTLLVFNKKDLLQDKLKLSIIQKSYPGSFIVSSLDVNDMTALKDHIINYFLSKQEHYDLFVPYQDGNIHSKIVGKTNIISTQNHEKGIFYRIKVPDFIFNSLGLCSYILSADNPLYKELLRLDELK